MWKHTLPLNSSEDHHANKKSGSFLRTDTCILSCFVLFYFEKRVRSSLKKNIKRIDRVLAIRRHMYDQKRSSVSYVSQKIEMYEVSS